MTTAYPLVWPDGWPRTKKEGRILSAFQVTFDKARTDLRRQLKLMGATGDVIISSCLPLRRNGEAYADDATVYLDDPGVAVYFTRRGRQLVLARDAYKTVLGNLRSVGLAIEHLRGLERHGGAPMLERAFTGFAQITSGVGSTQETCWQVLDVRPGAAKETILERFRHLAKEAHPDLGGNAEAFSRLKKARDEALNAGGQRP